MDKLHSTALGRRQALAITITRSERQVWEIAFPSSFWQLLGTYIDNACGDVLQPEGKNRPSTFPRILLTISFPSSGAGTDERGWEIGPAQGGEGKQTWVSGSSGATSCPRPMSHLQGTHTGPDSMFLPGRERQKGQLTTENTQPGCFCLGL